MPSTMRDAPRISKMSHSHDGMAAGTTSNAVALEQDSCVAFAQGEYGTSIGTSRLTAKQSAGEGADAGEPSEGDEPSEAGVDDAVDRVKLVTLRMLLIGMQMSRFTFVGGASTFGIIATVERALTMHAVADSFNRHDSSTMSGLVRAMISNLLVMVFVPRSTMAEKGIA